MFNLQIVGNFPDLSQLLIYSLIPLCSENILCIILILSLLIFVLQPRLLCHMYLEMCPAICWVRCSINVNWIELVDRVFQNFYNLTYFLLLIPNSCKKVLLSLTIIVDLSIYSFTSVSFLLHVFWSYVIQCYLLTPLSLWKVPPFWSLLIYLIPKSDMNITTLALISISMVYLFPSFYF